MWVWVSASQKIPLFWRETHTKGLRVRFRTRPEEDEGRNVPEQNTEEDRTDQSTEEIRAKNRALCRREQELGCVVTVAGLANVRR